MDSRKAKWQLRLIIAAAAAAAVQSPAFAQQTSAGAAPKEEPLEEIVVTARYREEKLQEIPIAITAITAKDIEVRGFTSSYELGYVTPNASLRPAQAAYGNTMTAFIRGVGQYDFDFAFEPGVGVYVDDVYQPFIMGTQMDLLDLERVEVLRGPQGTLFGRGSIGGAIRMESKRPVGDGHGSIQATVGEYDRVDVRGSYDFTIADGLFARVTGVSKQRDGWQDVIDYACAHPNRAGTLPVRDANRGNNCKTGTQGGEDVSGARGQLRWVANDALEFNLAAEYQDDSSEAKADSLLAVAYQNPGYDGYWNWSENYLGSTFGINYDDRFVTNDRFQTYATYNDPRSGLTVEPESSVEKTAVYGSADWHIAENLDAKLIVAWNDAESNFATDADGSPVNEQTVNGHEEMTWKTGELRLSGRAWDRLDWTVGGFIYDGEADNYQIVSIPAILYNVFTSIVGLPPPVAASLIEGPNNILVNARNLHDASNTSVFAHVVFDITDKLSINGGVRESNDEKDVDFDNTIVQTAIEIDEDHTDWRVGVDYQLTDDALVYSSVSTGYRPPAYNPRPFTPAQAVAVGGEELTAYEVGVKTEWFDHRLRLNLAGFYSDYEERIVPIGGTECLPGSIVPEGTPGALPDSNGNFCTGPTSLVSYQNAEAEVQGIELEATWRPIDPLIISGVFGLTDWQSDELDDCDFNGDGVADANVTCVSDTPNFVPEKNWSISAAYEFDLGNGSTLTPRVDVYGQTEICSSVVGPLSCADGYELVNVRLDWRSPDGAWNAAVGGMNVTDEEYLLNIFDLSVFGQPTVEGQFGRPAEWYFTVSRNF